MPDLNELLAWATANSTAEPQSTAEGNGELSLSFRPTSAPSAGTSALHPTDQGYTRSADSSVPNATPGAVDPTRAKREDLTTEMLDLIMGKSDSIIMKEKMAIATDESKTVDERTEALDDFEMLIELIDNANNMAILKLWQPLIDLLNSPEQPIVAHALWTIGTAVQNNLKSQAALYIFNAFPAILSIIYRDTPSIVPGAPEKYFTSTRSKATYALSAALKHWPLATSALSAEDARGFSVLKRGVVDSDPVIRRKMAFLVGTLTMQSGERHEGEIPSEVVHLIEEHTKSASGPSQTLAEALKNQGVYDALVDGLPNTDEDREFQENALRALSFAANKDALSPEQKSTLKTFWNGGKGAAEKFGLAGEDAEEFTKAFA